MNKMFAAAIFVCLNVLALNTSVFAQATPQVNANLQDAATQIPIPGIQAALTELYGSLKTIPGSNNSMAKKTFSVPGMGDVPLQLYVFGAASQQTVLLVVNRSIPLPNVLHKNVLKLMTGTSLTDPIFALSTVDFSLSKNSMPADLRQIVRNSYFDVDSLEFASGIQISSRASVKGILGDVIRVGMGVPVQDLTLRAGVVLPMPSDLRSGAGLLLSMPKSPKDLPQGQVEFQLAPGKVITDPMGMAGTTLSDATISINTSLTLGYKGNITITGTKSKFVTFFETPLNPAGALDLLDFKFGLSAPTVDLQDLAILAVSMNVSTVPGKSYLIKGIEKYMAQLKVLHPALAQFQIRNPMSVPDYRFGDKAHPFPPLSAFNILVFGPLATVDNTKGPLIKFFGNARIIGQQVGSMNVYVGEEGLHAKVSAGLNLKLGPLGRQGVTMTTNADVSQKTQTLAMRGNVLGRVLDLSLDGNELTMDSPATCATPFEIKAKAKITATMDVAALLDAQAGANVDPEKLQGCIGKDLEAARKWIATTGSSLGGYSAKQATAALDKAAAESKAIADKAAADAKAVADKAIADAKAAADAAAAYTHAKDAARTLANNSGNSAMKSFRDAGNFVKGIGKKKHKGGDNRFAPSVFDWDYYYDHNPDVVKSGMDLAEHWRDHGFAEARRGSFEFDLKYFRTLHSGSDSNLLNYWVGTGINKGDPSSPDFSIQGLLARNSDLKQAFGTNYRAAFDWWMENGGEDTHRDSRP